MGSEVSGTENEIKTLSFIAYSQLQYTAISHLDVFKLTF